VSKTDPITIRFNEDEMTGIKELADRTRLPVAEIVRRLCEFAFARTRAAGDISFLLEPTQTAMREESGSYKFVPSKGKPKKPVA